MLFPLKEPNENTETQLIDQPTSTISKYVLCILNL